jgi:hypothetical protein
MATQRNALKAKLTANSSWTALVTGGTYLTDDLPPQGLTPDIPADVAPIYGADGNLKLTCVITFGAVSGREIISTSQRRFFQLWLYHYNDYDLIQQAVDLAIDILHRKQFKADDTGLNMCHWADDNGEFRDEDLQNAAAKAVRFYIDSARK